MSVTPPYEVNSVDEIADLPNYTLVVAHPEEVEEIGIAVIALQKIADDWYAPGFPAPLNLNDLEPVFFPAQVVFIL